MTFKREKLVAANHTCLVCSHARLVAECVLCTENTLRRLLFLLLFRKRIRKIFPIFFEGEYVTKRPSQYPRNPSAPTVRAGDAWLCRPADRGRPRAVPEGVHVTSPASESTCVGSRRERGSCLGAGELAGGSRLGSSSGDIQFKLH